MIRVFLAEDHETVREGLRLLVNSQSDMEVVGEAGDGRAAVERAGALKPTVVVLDLTMPGMTGLAAARALKEKTPAAVVALTRHDDEAYVQELFSAGALGYVLKRSPSAELVRAIRAAASGTRYLDPALRNAPIDAELRRRPITPRVTERETEVLRRMAVGESNKDIAAALTITVKTVEVHKANAMRKLGLRGRTDVVKYAALNGWLQDP